MAISAASGRRIASAEVMFLALLIFLLVLFFTYLPTYAPIAARSICRYLFKATDEELNIMCQMKELKTEQDSTSMTDEFAKYFKLQRKIDKLGLDIKDRGSSRNHRITAITMAVQVAVQVLYVLFMLLLIYLFREEPILEFSSAWFFPIQKLIAFPTGMGGSVGIGFWLFLCNTIIHRTGRLISLTP